MKNNKKTQKIISFIWAHIKKYKTGFFFMFFLNIFVALERVYLPYLMGEIIDIATEIGPLEKIYWWSFLKKQIIFGLIAIIFMDFSFRVQEWIAEYIWPRFKASMRTDSYKYTLNHSAKFFSNEHSGSIGGKINDLAQFSSNIIGSMINVFSPVFSTAVISIIAITLINKKIAIVYSIWLFFHIFVTVSTVKIIEKYYRISAEKLNFLEGKIIDGINNVLNIRLFSKQNYEMEYIKKFQNNEIDASYRAGIVGILIRSVLSFLTIIGIAAVFYTGIKLWETGEISIGSLNAVMGILINTILMVWWFSYEFNLFSTNFGRAKTSFEIMEEKNEINKNLDAPNIVVGEGKIEFKNVVFSHDNKLFFQNQSIIIKAKENIGLVGYSGAGKTTFANLILREFDLQEGEILIDGQNIKNFNLPSLHNQVAYITQNVLLFHRTIRENLLIAKEDATEEELIEACKAANCYELVLSLENGFDSEVGEQGSKLSGGQKQRIAIARGILKGAKIIILDEATSALDSITENKIQKALDVLSTGKTTITIAHRLSTLKNVDRILVFEKGQIIEDGTHDELILKNGFYAKLYNNQNQDRDFIAEKFDAL